MFRKRFVFLSLLLALLLVFVIAGCEEEENDDNQDPAYNHFSDLSLEEQAEMADAMAEESFYYIDYVKSMSYAADTGDLDATLTGVSPLQENPRLRSAIRVATPPDTFWTGPDGEGWYSYSSEEDLFGILFSIEINVRWTPDIWATALFGEPVTKLELSSEMTGSYDGQEILSTTEAFMVEVNEARTHTSGTGDVSMSSSDEGYGSVEYNLAFAWSDVAVAPDDYQGDYTVGMEMIADYYDTELMGQYTFAADFDQSFSFETDGSGTGTASIDGEEVIRFVFDPVTMFTRSGYYLLASESFAIEHDFSFYIY